MWHLPTHSLALILAALPVSAAVAPIHVVVAKDGTGDFPTVQNAVDHVMDRVLTPFPGR